MSAAAQVVGAKRGRLPPEVNRILHVRNLPRKVTAEELYDVFGKYGPIRQIRVGTAAGAGAGAGAGAAGGKGADLRGTAFVIYEDIYDAKQACDHLSGFNVGGRYLTVLYYQVRAHAAAAAAAPRARRARMRAHACVPPRAPLHPLSRLRRRR